MNFHGLVEKTTQTDQTKSKIISVCLFILKNGEFDDVSYRVVKQTEKEECLVMTYDHLFGILGENIDPLSISISHRGTCKIFILFRPVKIYDLVINGLFDTVHFLNILRHFHKEATFCPGISLKFLQTDIHPSAIVQYEHPFPRSQSVDCPVYWEKSDGLLSSSPCFPCNSCSLLMVKTSDKNDCNQDINLPSDTVSKFASKEHDVCNQKKTNSALMLLSNNLIQPSFPEDSRFDNNDDAEPLVKQICSFNKKNHTRSSVTDKKNRKHLAMVSTKVSMKHSLTERKHTSVSGEPACKYVNKNSLHTALTSVNDADVQVYPNVQIDGMSEMSICETSKVRSKVAETIAEELEANSTHISERNKVSRSCRTCIPMIESEVTCDHAVSVESNNQIEVSPTHGQITDLCTRSGRQNIDATQILPSQKGTHSKRLCDLKYSVLQFSNTGDCCTERIENSSSNMETMPSVTATLPSVLHPESASETKQNDILRTSTQFRNIKHKRPRMINATLRLDDVIAQLKKSVSKPQLSVLHPQLDGMQPTSQETIDSASGKLSNEDSEVNKNIKKWPKRKRKPSKKGMEYLESLKCKSYEREVLSMITKRKTGKNSFLKCNSVAVETVSSFCPDFLKRGKATKINKTGLMSGQKIVSGASNKQRSSCSEPILNASEMLQKSQESIPLKPPRRETETLTRRRKESSNHIQANNSDDMSVVKEDDVQTDTETQLKRTVKGEEKHKPTQCPVCYEFYSNERTLGRHMRIHNLVRPFKCPVCEKSFVQKITMKVHMRLHSGEKPHQCIICGRSFAQKSNMETHVRRHLGVRPYQCDMCSKGFSDKGSLGEHKKIHTGEQPYVCTVCGKSFSQRANMRTHLHRHQEEKSLMKA
ncbi:uncharacterized protein LOC124270676 [Haliotis rubra]|uniref:uncharacterized protein LOC124270676 n=1 Tax=Haliotis rubra TaxID=36100 RepID=UPI001EE52B61|nr:uncharacterized protein LOC124270676 [Haliotis rubra]